MKRTILAIGVVLVAGCGTTPPTPPVPTPIPVQATPTPTPTPTFDYAGCIQQATQTCNATAAGDQAALSACMTIRTHTCKVLGGQ
jgi:hypothetical protein